MRKPKNRGNILKSFLTLCPPFSHEGLWQGLPVGGDIRRPPPDPASVVSQLQRQYSQADLLAAGIFVPDSAGSAQLDPRVCDPQTLLIGLRKAQQEDPFELLVNRGTLSGRELPLCASLRDGAIRKLIRKTKENVLFVAASTLDAAVLLSLGLPATLRSGLGQLGGVHLEQVRQRFELPSPRPKPGGSTSYRGDAPNKAPPDLLLVGFALAELSPAEPPGLAEIVAHLAGVRNFLEVPLDCFYLWQPAAEAIEGIAFRLAHANPTAVRTAIVAGLDNTVRQLIPPRRSEGMPQDLPAAIREMANRVCSQDRSADWERRAWENIRQLLETTCIQPMFAAAAATHDPLQRNLWTLAATKGQLLYPQAMQMLFRMAQELRGKQPTRVIQFPKVEFEQRMAATDRMLKIFKEIRECRQNPWAAWKKHRC